MSKKDYQRIARAIHDAASSMCAGVLRQQNHEAFDGLMLNIVGNIAQVMAEDSSRFDRARFIEACETGRCKGMRQVSNAGCSCGMADLGAPGHEEHSR